MPRLQGEEKEDAQGGGGGIDEQGGGNDTCSQDDDDTCSDDSEELVDLPPEITKLIDGGEDRVFESEAELLAALENSGVGDLRVVLVDGKPRLVMPSDQHNSFTSIYVVKFLNFCNTLFWGKWGFCSGTHKIHLQPGGSHLSRDPDLSYWGYPRCTKDKDGDLLPTNKGSIPDVVVQFSWKNTKKYETEVIDDMMNRGLEHDHGALSTSRPTLGYLIKVKFSKKRALPGAIKGSKTQDLEGLSIYRLPHGTTTDDAHDVNNNYAEVWDCFPGGPESFIVITPQDLGITGISAALYGEYKIKVSEIFQSMQEYQKERQAMGLAT